MRKAGEIIRSVHDEVRNGCHGRCWWIRLPLLLWFAYIFVNHLADSKYQSLFGALNLGIHELGHFVFAVFGQFVGMAGGAWVLWLMFRLPKREEQMTNDQ